MQQDGKEIWMVQTKRADFKGLAQKLGVSPVSVRIMRNRGLETEEAMRRYLYGTADESGKNALRRLRFTSVLGLLALMLGVCCFVFFQLYAMPAYYHDSALIAGMIAGCVFVVAAGFLFAVGLVGWVSYARRAEKKR